MGNGEFRPFTEGTEIAKDTFEDALGQISDSVNSIDPQYNIHRKTLHAEHIPTQVVNFALTTVPDSDFRDKAYSAGNRYTWSSSRMDGDHWQTAMTATFGDLVFFPEDYVLMTTESGVAGILIRANLMINRGMLDQDRANDDDGTPLTLESSSADWRYITLARLQYKEEVASTSATGVAVTGWQTIESSVRWVDSETSNDGGKVFDDKEIGRSVRGYKDLSIAAFLPANTLPVIAPTKVSAIRLQLALFNGRYSSFVSSDPGIVVTRAGELSAIALRGRNIAGTAAT